MLASTAGNDRKMLEKSSGFKYEPDAVLYDASLRNRGIYKPYTHMIRDCMHVVLNNGVANSQIYELMLVLRTLFKIKPEDVYGYIANFKLPGKLGRVNANWLGKDVSSRRNASSHLSLGSCSHSYLS